MRPQSIIWFERLYLGAWAIGVINALTFWDRNTVAIRKSGIEETLPGYQYWTTGLGFLIPLILWYFIARQGSAVAKWILVVLVALGVASIVTVIVNGRLPQSATGLLGLVAIALQIAAASLLFRQDTKPWFGERRGDAVA